MQTKITTHPPLGNRTTTAGSCVRSNLGRLSRKSSSPPKCQTKRGTIFEHEVVVYFVTYLCWFQWCGWYVKNLTDSILCLKVSHPFVPMMVEKKVSCFNRVQQVDAAAGGKPPGSEFHGRAMFFFPMFSERFPMLWSLNVINMSWPGLSVPISSGHCLLWTNNFTWPSCKKKANGLLVDLVTFLSAAFLRDLWSFKPSSNCW